MFNGVTLRWIDVRKGIWIDWKVWGEVFGRMVSHGLPDVSFPASPTMAILVRLCRFGNEFWCRLVIYPCSLPCWPVLRPCWVVFCFNLCIIFCLCLLLCCVLFVLLVVDFGQSLCVCLGMPCWWEMLLLGGNPTLGRRRRVIENWTLPPSEKMRHRVAGVNSRRPHTGIAVNFTPPLKHSHR